MMGTSGPVFMWTWAPASLPQSVLGTWNNSTPGPQTNWISLGNNQWLFKMRPTVKDYYGVSAADVYSAGGIRFLAKLQDGLNGSDCLQQNKTEDLFIPITPPYIPPPTVKSFPSKLPFTAPATKNDTILANPNNVFKLMYNKNVADSTSRTFTGYNVFATATFSDGTTYTPVSPANLSSTAATHMLDPDGDNIYEWSIIPSQYFVPPSGPKTIAKIACIIYRDGASTFSPTTTVRYPTSSDYLYTFIFGCH
jgi:hypothetical protein